MMSEPFRQGFTLSGSTVSGDFAEMGVMSGSRDYTQCAGREQVPPQRAISACDRIIGERISREYTSAALFFRARLYRAQGDSDRARRDYDRALETLNAMVMSEPRRWNYWHNRAAVRYELNDFDGAFDDYGHVVALEDTQSLARMRRGAILFRRGAYAEAVAEFDAAARIEPRAADAHRGRCEARAASGSDWANARAACNEALRLSNASAAALSSRGFLNFMEGRTPEAMADFMAAGQKDNANALALYGFSVVTVRMGQEEEGRALMARVTARFPDVEIYVAAGLRP